MDNSGKKILNLRIKHNFLFRIIIIIVVISILETSGYI